MCAALGEMVGRGVAPMNGTLPTVLVIEDDVAVAQMLSIALSRECLLTVFAADGVSGVSCFRDARPALIVLDLMLPRMSGIDVCRHVRSESSVPIVVVSALDSEDDRVAALEAGADDYLTKPFSVKELIARIRGQLRRSAAVQHIGDSSVIERGPVYLDSSRHEVHVRGVRVQFTPKEFKLLETLVVADGRLRTRGSIIDNVWGSTYLGDTKTLDVHVKRLRAKIERDPHRPEHIVTVRGLGYRFLDEPARTR